MELPCSNCGAPLKRTPYQAKKYSRAFCNATCRGRWQSRHGTGANNPNWRGGLVAVSCAHCGQAVEKAMTEIRKSDVYFCNRACQAAHQAAHWAGENSASWKGGKATYSCDNCGAALRRYTSQIKPGRQFCNRQCLGEYRARHWVGPDHPNWKGGEVEYYGPNWNQTRRDARHRDNYTCQVCMVSETELGQELCVHHITPFREFGLDRYAEANQLENLISLCPACHMRAEYGKIPIQPKLC